MEYTSGHRKRRGRPRWGYDSSGEVRVKRFDIRLNFRREVISKKSMFGAAVYVGKKAFWRDGLINLFERRKDWK